MYRILIVEDDPVIAEAMKNELAGWGYDSKTAEDFSNIMTEFDTYTPHLVLLDLNLPFQGGFYWCGKIRETSKVPIIFISSSGDDMNLVTALHQGGDDFIPKPFELSVLVAKVQALLRRTYDFGAPSDILTYRGATLDLGRASLFTENGKRVELSTNEFRILHILLENKGKIVSRDTLMRRLWESENFIDDNTLSVNIARLRKKLDEAGLKDCIETKKGYGYLIEA